MALKKIILALFGISFALALITSCNEHHKKPQEIKKHVEKEHKIYSRKW